MNSASVARIVEIADWLFPFELAEAWDNSGLQLGDSNAQVDSIAFSLDPTPPTIRFAAESSCQLLVTHHPLIMDPIRSVTSKDLVGRAVLEAAKSGVSVLSLHTNLDAAPGGLNDFLAGRLGLMDIETPEGASCSRIGALPTALPVRDFAERIKRSLDIPALRIVSEDNREVRRIFVVSGSGMGYLQDALRHGADLMVTGDVRYHAAREALEMGIPVIDAGHFGLEKFAVEILSAGFSAEFTRIGLALRCVPYNQECEPFTAQL